MIEYGWNRRAINIIKFAILFSKNLSKREHNLKCDVFGIMERIFSSGVERILIVILNNFLGSEDINAIFLL